MPSVGLSPVANISFNSHWSISGVAPAYAEISDGSDSTYIEADGNGKTCTFQLGTPGDPAFDVATAVTINARLADPNANGFTFQVFQSDGTTALTSQVGTGGGASFASYGLTPTLSGSQTAAAWTNAKIKVTALGQTGELAELSVAVTYTTTGGGGLAAPLLIASLGSAGMSAANGLVPNSLSRRNRVEGVRHRYT